MSDTTNTAKRSRKTVKSSDPIVNVDAPVDTTSDNPPAGPEVKRGRGRPVSITSMVAKRAAMGPKVERAQRVLAEFEALNEKIKAMGDDALRDALAKERSRLADLESMANGS